MRGLEEFTVKSTRVSAGLSAEDITKDMFSKKSSNIVDKRRLGVVFDAQERAPCCISEEPDEHLSLAPLEISSSQETSETAESSTHSVSVLDNKPIDFSRKQDKKQYTSSDSSWTEPERVQLVIKSRNRAPLWEHHKKVLLELTGSDSTIDRLGLDLVVILDVGASSTVYMEKMAQLKTGIRFMMQKLTPVDRLSVITFSSYAVTKLYPLRQMTRASKHELQGLIDGLEAAFGGNSNIEDGLMAGLKVLADRKVGGDDRAVGIMLMSDGEQLVGDDATQPLISALGNVPVYTFGFGKVIDLKVLSAIVARSMGGTFSHIKDIDAGGGVRQLTMAFSQCLASQLTISVRDLEVTVAAVGDMSRILKAAAGSCPQWYDGDDNVTLSLGNLYSREVRKVIVDVLLPATQSERNAEFLKVTYSYRSRSSGGRLQFVAPPESLTVWRTGSVTAISEETMPELQWEEVRLQTAKIIKDVCTLCHSYPWFYKAQLQAAQKMQVEAQNGVLEEQPLFRRTSINVARWEEEMRRLSLEMED